MSSKYLFSKKPIVVDVELASHKEIGLNGAIVIQQIHYWIEKNRAENKNSVNGRYWVYNSITDWRISNFPFWSEKTISRIFEKLESQGILISGNFNKQKRDRTKWYTIDYKMLDEIMGSHLPKSENASGQNDQMSLGQNDQMDLDNMTQPLPETNTEINTDINTSCSTSPKSNEDDEPLQSYEPKIIALTDLLIRRITENNPRAPVPEKSTKNYFKWVDEIDKLNRIGPVGGSGKGYSIKEIYDIIEWCQEDSFWKNNILSASKLRKKIVQLENKMKTERPRGGGTNGGNRSYAERGGPSEETRRLERIAKDKGIIKPGGIQEPDIDF